MSKKITLEQIKSQKFHFPLLIPVFNNFTYLKNTIDFFNSIGMTEILILNNGSEYEPLKKYLESLPDEVRIIDFYGNPGPRVFFENKFLYESLPNKFMVTDPDLGFKTTFDSDALNYLVCLSDEYKAFKIGSALRLDIEEPNALDFRVNWVSNWTTIRQTESDYYLKQAGTTEKGETIFIAPIDTTFAIYNKKYLTDNVFLHNCYRVSGRFAAIHYGWLLNPPIPAKEYEFYKKTVGDASSTEAVKLGKKTNSFNSHRS